MQFSLPPPPRPPPPPPPSPPPIIMIIIIMIIINHKASKRQITHKHTPKSVCEREDVTVLWNQEVHTDREVIANRPDIIIKNKTEKTCILIDVAIPADRHIAQKEAEKKINTRVCVWSYSECGT
jgi:hypothetical protein